MSNVKVSADFNKFYGRAAAVVEEAKKAENTMSSSPTPVGWKGQCVLLGATADVSKEKTDDKGNKTGGNPWVRLEFGIVGDEKYQGKKFNLFHSFYDTKNATAGDRFTWFLNECENLGVPREVREQHESLEELLTALMALDGHFDAECVADNYNNDGKKMRVRKSAEAVDTSTSMMPTTEGDGATTTSSAPANPSDPQEGDEVDYLGKKWKVLAREGDHLELQHPERPDSKRQITLDQLG